MDRKVRCVGGEGSTDLKTGQGGGSVLGWKKCPLVYKTESPGMTQNV